MIHRWKAHLCMARILRFEQIALMLQEGGSEDPDTELLREQMRVMADELEQREAALEALQNSDVADNYEVELQVLHCP